jgi:acetylornithine deacetylase
MVSMPMNDAPLSLIRAAAVASRDVIVRDLEELVRLPSYSPAVGGPGERAVQEYLARAYASLGCRITRWEPDPARLHARFPAVKASVQAPDFAGRPNLVALLPGAEPDADDRTAGVILNSHADTVPPGPEELWPHPPLDAVRADGRIYGLGAADAKGCLVTFLGALRILDAAGIRLRRGVMVQSVVDEEAGGAGALACVERGYRAPLALVGEPTGLRVCPASRGSYSFTMTVAGRKSHPGSPWLGVNAVDKALQCIEALRAMQRRLDRERMHPFWAPLPLGHVWNIMAINTGPNARALPDRCTVNFGAGAVAGEDAATIHAFVAEALANATAADPWLREHPPEIVWSGLQMDAAATDPDHPAIEQMAEAGRSLGIEPGLPVAFSAATDGRHLTNFGGVPCINFGPGDIGICHSPQESLPVDDLITGATWVALFLARSLGIAAEPGKIGAA